MVRALYARLAFYAGEEVSFQLDRFETTDAGEVEPDTTVVPTVEGGLGISGTLAKRTWSQESAPTEGGRLEVKQASFEPRWVPLEQAPPWPVGLFELAAARGVEEPLAFTTYRVNARLAGRSRAYDAAAVWYRCGGSDQIGFEALDFVTDGLEAVALLDLPRADPSWPPTAPREP